MGGKLMATNKMRQWKMDGGSEGGDVIKSG